jgi:crotonobetainyl-CoA:carnitine CoA-transferase CaiB-like acyl-CoA transferase
MIVDPSRSALDGLRVIEVGDRVACAHAGQLLADFGAEVVLIEPPGGRASRDSAAFAFLARGKRSVVLDLAEEADRDRLRRMVDAADVLIEDFEPGVAAGLELDYACLALTNPGLVDASVTGFGNEGPYARVKGYEPLVLARIGGLHVFSPMVDRAGPAYVSVPFGEFSAGQIALHGIMSAMLERSRSGRGQQVSTSLLAGIASLDVWNWFLNLLTTRYSGAFTPAPHVQDGVPNSALIYRLLVALSADGTWMQFSQTSRHLYVALMDALGFGWMFDDPRWSAIPLLEDPALRVELWDRMLAAVRERTLPQWADLFDAQPNVWAEPFRRGGELLDHPQIVHEGSVVEIADPHRGVVRQPGPLAHLSATPARLDAPAPALGADADEVERWRPRIAEPVPGRCTSEGAADRGAPLSGITVLELGLYFAAPYAGSVLADLGARVIKVEPIGGDPLRSLASFPEIGAIKAVQGKECIALDLASPEAQRIVHELVADCDLVIQSFRAGVAERLNVDAATLMAINPRLVYVDAPGYGVDGPCGHRPAYAPTIAAASGIAWRLAGPTMPEDPGRLSIAEEKHAAVRLVAATNTSFAQCDGLSALAVASASLLALLARDRGAGGQRVNITMLSTAAHVNCEDVVAYPGRPETPTPDRDLFGLNARYRLYPTADGWVFLAVPTASDWLALVAQSDFAGVVESQGDEELAARLASILSGRPARDWERRLTAAGVGCVAVTPATVESVLMSDEFGRASGLVADVDHPMLGEHPRLASLVRFSRSHTEVGAGTVVGQHTIEVLHRAGYADDTINDLAGRAVIGIPA